MRGSRWLILALLLSSSRARASGDVRQQIETFLGDWERAQSRQGFSRYQTLYAPDFVGVRRSGERAVELTRAAWMQERRRMFEQPVTVRARDLVVSEGAGGAWQVTFNQTWSSGAYADRGEKRMLLRKDGRGTWRIVREEMLSSEIDRTPIVPEAPGDAPLVKLIYPRNAAQPASAEAAWRFVKKRDEQKDTARGRLRLVFWHERNNPYWNTSFDDEYLGGFAVLRDERLLGARYALGGDLKDVHVISAKDRVVFALTLSFAMRGETSEVLEVFELAPGGLRSRLRTTIVANNKAGNDTFECEATVEMRDVNSNGVADLVITPVKRRRPQSCHDFPARPITVSY